MPGNFGLYQGDQPIVPEQVTRPLGPPPQFGLAPPGQNPSIVPGAVTAPPPPATPTPGIQPTQPTYEYQAPKSFKQWVYQDSGLYHGPKSTFNPKQAQQAYQQYVQQHNYAQGLQMRYAERQFKESRKPSALDQETLKVRKSELAVRQQEADFRLNQLQQKIVESSGAAPDYMKVNEMRILYGDLFKAAEIEDALSPAQKKIFTALENRLAASLGITVEELRAETTEKEQPMVTEPFREGQPFRGAARGVLNAFDYQPEITPSTAGPGNYGGSATTQPVPTSAPAAVGQGDRVTVRFLSGPQAGQEGTILRSALSQITDQYEILPP